VTETTFAGRQEVGSGGDKRGWVDYLLLAAPCFSSPLLLWAENIIGVSHPGRLLTIGATASIVAAVILATVRRLGVPGSVSLAGVWALAYVFMRGAAVVSALGYVLAFFSTVTVIVILGFLLSRRPQSPLRVIVVISSAVLVAEVGLAWYTSGVSLGADLTLPAPSDVEVALERTPDIVLILADAYIGLDGLERYFDIVEPAWKKELDDRGFTVPEVAYSPYVTTQTALSAILDIAYPIGPGPGITKATNQTLYDKVGGDNRVFRILASNGYGITMVESGWSGSACGDRIDTCVPSHFLDESTYFALHKTWVGPWMRERYGYSFTVGALNAMSWLRENLGGITHDSKPDFVIAHLEVPHPPFFLDSDCKVETARARSGTTMQWPGTDIGFRKEAYLGQAACFDRFVQGLIEKLGEDTFLLVAGDHGSDSHDQLVVHPSRWSEDAIRERLNVMFAYRDPDGCELTKPILLANVFRDVFQCLGGKAVPSLEPRMFIYAAVSFDGMPSPVVELHPSQVDELLNR